MKMFLFLFKVVENLRAFSLAKKQAITLATDKNAQLTLPALKVDTICEFTRTFHDKLGRDGRKKGSMTA